MKHMGNTVNEMLDNLSAFTWRLYELPTAFLLLGVLAAAAGIWLLLRIAGRWKRRELSWLAGGLVLLVSLQLVQALVADRRALRLQQELRQLRESTIGALLAGNGEGRGGGLGASLAEGSVGADRPKQKIPRILQGVLPSWNVPYRYRRWRVDPGLDYYRLTYENPKAVVHVAVVDLQTGLYEIVLPREVSQKTTTSVFAAREQVLVAVNGEAGVSPARDARLGEWKGNYIVNGQAVYLDDDDRRPFLAFDREPTGRYFPAAVVDCANTPEKYNTIWGRYDLLVDGKLAAPDPQDETAGMRYSRTILGINRSGKTLFLMVVDGSDPRHSLGLTMEECGRILIGMGCKLAMACDQGGSACMCIGGAGTVSSPSGGADRHVYTHFGVRRRNHSAAADPEVDPESDGREEGGADAAIPLDDGLQE
jgi:hypothetical protein